MRVLIFAPGSMGDVAPLAGLGGRLRDVGHEVAVAAHEPFRALIEAAGLEFRGLRGDPQQMGASEAGQRWQTSGNGPAAMARMARLMAAYMDEMSPDLVTAAEEGADVILVNSVAVFLGYHVARGLGIPSAGVFLAPLHPTGDFPPASLTMPNLGPSINRAVGRMILAAGASSFARTTKALRSQLGLPPMRAASLWKQMDHDRWPVFYGFSPSVLPRPRDWGPALEVTGYWWPPASPGWRPSAELEEFLDAGPAPVYVGLGSRNIDDARIETTIRDALQQAGLRGVVQAGWAGLSIGGDDILTIGETSHEWLFPRMAAVAHHCGAGTTAAGLRAGVPTVGIPVLADQPFWATRLVTLGASPGTILLKHLTADRLAAALRSAVDESHYRSRARELAADLQLGDGADRVASVLQRLR